MLVPECAASMIGVPVPSISICECGAGGDAWEKTRGAEVNATKKTHVLKLKARQRERGANSERFM